MKTAAPVPARLAWACLALLAAAVPAHAQDQRAWSVSLPKKPADTAYLSFAVPESDDVGLALSCKVKTGQISLHFDAEQRLAARQRGEAWLDKIGRPAPWPISVTIASGAASTTVRGLANPDEMNGGSSVTAEISDRAPVVAAFAKTGALRLQGLGTTVEEPPAPKKHVGRFLKACRL